MGNQTLKIEPGENIPLVDCHCHIPYPDPPKEMKHSYEDQYQSFIKKGGQFIITSSVDNATLKIMHDFSQKHEKCYLSVGFAPQTVTYTRQKDLENEYIAWKKFLFDNPDAYVSIGEIGLDFHHGKSLKQRNLQIQFFERILNETKELDKPYVLHVRNPSGNDVDKEHPEHNFNNFDAANQEIIKVLKKCEIHPRRVMWHCFAGPKGWGSKLAKMGFYLSTITSGYRNKKMRSYTADVSIDQLLTETDSFWQHPFKYHGFNEPGNVKYAIATISFTHNIDQRTLAMKILENAEKFFGISHT